MILMSQHGCSTTSETQSDDMVTMVAEEHPYSFFFITLHSARRFDSL